MTEIEDRLEVDRLQNLVTGFGWRIQKQEFLLDKIVITLEKSRTPSEETMAGAPA